MRRSLAKILTLTDRNLKEIVRDPLSLIFTIALPLFMEILFYFLFHGMTAQFEMRFLAPGIVVFSQSFLTLFTGLLIATDRNTSFLTRLYVSDTKSFEFIFGYAFAVLPMALVQSVLFFIVGGLFDASLFGLSMLWAILLSSCLSSFFFIAFGILFGSLCNEKSIGGMSSIIITGQSILSGMWFPVEGLDGAMVAIMNILPFKNATLLIQNTVNGINNMFDDFVYPLLIVVGYTLVALVVAIITFRNKMKAK
ncbi:MAG: ABC transporter permease [Clostridia bacterium]|nr:ABC transporter permease [Clostridia bacterium]